MKTILLSCLMVSLCQSPLNAQESQDYELKGSREVPLLVDGLGLNGFGFILENQIEPLSEQVIGALDISSIPSIQSSIKYRVKAF